MYRDDINKLDYQNPHDVALLCSYLSSIAYMDSTNQRAWLNERLCMDYFESSSYKNLQYFIVYDRVNNNAYFVIRGTEINKFRKEWRDLRVSIYMCPKKANGSKGHYGYITAGENLLKRIQPAIEKAHDAGFNVILTGHSLGGVLAKYIGCMVKIPNRVFMFGSPCLAKSDFYKDMDHTKVYKYRNRGDIIPYYPSLLYNDKFGELYRLYNGTINKDRLRRRFLIPLIFMTQITLFALFFKGIKRHSMTLYTLNLLKYQKKNKNKNKTDHDENK